VRLVTLVGVTVSAVVLSMLSLQSAAADTRPAAGTAETVSSDSLPVPQVDGVVWDQVVIGDTVYVGGKFTTTRPTGNAAGVGTSVRNNLLAYNIKTGALLSWAPSTDQQVLGLSASPDGKRLYAVGDFTNVAGQGRQRIAAFDVATGALSSAFVPIANRQIMEVVATNSAVYVGGTFSTVAQAAGGTNQNRSGVAAYSATNGGVLPWAPVPAGGSVRAMVLSPDNSKLVLGGSFTTLNGSDNPGYGLGAVDTTSGANVPWASNSDIRNAGKDAAIYDLGSDGTKVYGVGYEFGSGGNLEGTFSADWNGGALTWVADCHGDSYSVSASPESSAVYTAGHAHYCGNLGTGGFPQTDPWTFNRAIAFSKDATGISKPDIYGYDDHPGKPSPSLLDWFPDMNAGSFTGMWQGPWDVLVSGDYVLYGGEFTTVNGTRQQGLARFASKEIAPNKDGPRLSGSNFTPTVASFTRGSVRVSWPANYDRDNSLLTYDIIRNGQTATPIYTTQVASNFYTRPIISFTDEGLTPGATYQYRLRVKDPFGNSVFGDTVSIVASTDGAISTYGQEVLDDNPAAFWPLGETSGTTGYDWATGDDLTLSGDLVRSAPGQENGTSSTSTTFAGNSATFGVSTAPQEGPNTFSVEAWIKTDSTSGGKIIGFGNARTGESNSYDRHVYMDNSGRLTFGVYTGGSQTVTSGSSYNDNQWHHVVASMGSAGMQLYVDSKKVASRADITAAQVFTGRWRVGGDNLGGWPNGPTSNYFAGSIDDVAVYSTVLTRQQIDAHYVASGRESTIPVAPSDAYGASVFALEPTSFWRLGEAEGSVAADSGPFGNPGTYTGLVEKGAAGAIEGTSDTAATFAPTEEWWGWNEAGVASANAYTNPTTYALEAWFRTTTTRGGKIIGFGASPTGGSGGYDRHVYMENDGRLTFGTWTGQENIVRTDTAFNDGEWHHVVAQQSSAGMKMFVDGSSVGTNPQTGAQDYTGYWRVGGDTTWGGTAPYFSGTIDEVAVYSAPLTDAQVEQHHDLGLGDAPNVLPTAEFTSSSTDLTASFDATTSSDSDGTIASSMWDFGDGTVGTGSTVSHDYEAAGTYEVSLTVTDNRGGVATVTKSLAVTAPNAAPSASFTAETADLRATFDATASADPDGTIASYAWNFGDQATATGATTDHTYREAGDYLVSLTVTDNRGGTATTTRIITATVPANQEPTASFTARVSNLEASFDASASTDPDGTVASYGWNFGDGATATGALANHTYTDAGTYLVILTVTDDRGATSTSSKTITTTVTPNQNPSASFTATVTSLDVAVDASASTDPDGTISSYAWDFGDDTSATGTKTNHTYATAGTYTVTLTVTDNRGGTATTTRSVTVAAAPAASTIAADAFGRTTSGAWGNATTGGAWTVSGGASSFSVASGKGVISTPAGGTRTARLDAVTSNAATTTATFSSATVGNGGGTYLTVIGRQVGSANYTARVWIAASGVPRLYIQRDGTVLQNVAIPGISSYTAGTALTVAFEVTGTSPTSLKAKVWKTGDAVPTAWQAQTTDGAAGLQVAGSTGASTYLSGSATNGPAVISFDDYTVTSGSPAPEPTNQAPTAAFTSSTSGLTASVDGSSSTDRDGTVASYAWNFGDGTTGTGKTTTHLYTSAGTYTVTLTVTDNAGATHSRAASLSVTAPPATTSLALDEFERTTTGGWGTAAAGGTWTVSGGASGFGVSGGKATIANGAGQTRSALLPGTTSTATDTTTSFTIAEAPTGGGQYVNVIGRQIAKDFYSARVWIRSNGVIQLQALHGGTLLQTVDVPSLAYTPGTEVMVRVQVSGTNPTTVRGKVWLAGQNEPAAWTVSRTDTSSTMQAAGTVGLEVYVSGSATTVPTTVRFTRFESVTIG
jgi:PKD repeat protein